VDVVVRVFQNGDIIWKCWGCGFVGVNVQLLLASSTSGGLKAVLELLLTSVVLCHNNFLDAGGGFLFRCY